jgi:sortase A
VSVEGASSVAMNAPRRTRSTLARLVGATGRALIAAGVVVLLFAAYQLWGTEFREAASQRTLRAEFERQLLTTPTGPARPGSAIDGRTADELTVEHAIPGPTTSAQPRPVPPAAVPAPPPPAPGDPVAVLRIPKLDLDKVVVEGTDVASLRKGPGHQPGTAALGQPGNAVIGGHRTTYGAPFYRLDELDPGDAIIVQVPAGELRYTVTRSQVVEPTDVWILDPTADDRLTLFTCTPRFSAAQRLVVTAALDGPPLAVAAVPAAAPAATPSPAPEDPPLQDQPPSTQLAAATGSVAAAAAWAAATASIAGILWFLGRRYRRLVAYPLGTPVLAVALFITFEHVATLLPSAV